MTELMSRRGRAEVDRHAPFTVRAWLEGSLRVVAMSGDLDLASRAAALEACTSVHHQEVLVDLSGLRFIDCAGYGGLVAATAALERRGGSMVMSNPAGEPRRLLALIEQLGHELCAPLRFGKPHVSPPATPT